MTISPATFEFVRVLLRRKAAISLDSSKQYLVETRLLSVARDGGFDSIDALVDNIQKRPGGPLEQQVVEAMTTNETSFFRDQMPFDTLRTEILPDLLRCRAGQRRLDIWSAACSSGQEPYSVAMVLREHFAGHRDWQINIVASDLSTEVLRRARRGVFSQFEMDRGLPEAFRNKYFERVSDGWRVNAQIRDMVEFREVNLIGRWQHFPPMDLVLLRNVLVYFDTETKVRVLERIRGVLRPDGFLMLGGAETTLHLDRQFARIARGGFSFYQKCVT